MLNRRHLVRLAGATALAPLTARSSLAQGSAAITSPWPNRIVKLSPPGDEYPDIGKSAVYICSDKTCSSPVTDPTKLAEEAKKTIAIK